MKFENTGIEGKEFQFSTVHHILEELGFVHAAQWDYERVTFDYKFEDHVKNDVYYLRVQAFATEGDIPSPYAKVKFITPLLGKHYYPHGVEYGEGENFPKNVTTKSTQLLESLKSKLESVTA